MKKKKEYEVPSWIAFDTTDNVPESEQKTDPGAQETDPGYNPFGIVTNC